ncbi:MAG: mucoidy inhibitor MuiA family protein [Candidatus Thorarchaeota archaeon]
MATIVEAPVERVTVFVDGARITRMGEASLSQGKQEIVVGGITHFAEDDSFRLKGTGKATIRGIKVDTRKEIFQPGGDTETLRNKLRKLEDERNGISEEIAIEEGRIERLQIMLNTFSEEFGKRYAFGDSEISAMAAIDEKTTAMRTEAHASLRESRAKMKEIDAKIAAVRSSLQRIEGERKIESTKEVRIGLDVEEECVVHFKVTYQVREARWLPQYDIDLMSNKTALKRLALVWNHSLEDWAEVELTVSTASAKPVSRVEADPLYIQTRRSDTERPLDRVEDVIAHMEKSYGNLEEMRTTSARVSETASGGMVFQVPGEVSIPADRDQHPVTLLEEEFDSEEVYYWNAYAMDEFVIQNRIINGDSLIIPGKMKVYSDGDFLSETAISTVAPREEFYLGTRGAYDVQGEKKMLEKETERAGLTRGKKQREYTYRLELESFAKEAINVRIIDRIPHSDSDRISVELEDVNREYKSIELGVIEWEFEILAEEKTAIDYTYSVEWEKDTQITPPLP